MKKEIDKNEILKMDSISKIFISSIEDYSMIDINACKYEKILEKEGFSSEEIQHKKDLFIYNVRRYNNILNKLRTNIRIYSHSYKNIFSDDFNNLQLISNFTEDIIFEINKVLDNRTCFKYKEQCKYKEDKKLLKSIHQYISYHLTSSSIKEIKELSIKILNLIKNKLYNLKLNYN